MLKLSKGPEFLQVPGKSDFSAYPEYISVPMPAYMCCKCHALSIRPTGQTSHFCLLTFEQNQELSISLLKIANNYKKPVSPSPNI